MPVAAGPAPARERNRDPEANAACRGATRRARADRTVSSDGPNGPCPRAEMVQGCTIWRIVRARSHRPRGGTIPRTSEDGTRLYHLARRENSIAPAAGRTDAAHGRRWYNVVPSGPSRDLGRADRQAELQRARAEMVQSCTILHTEGERHLPSPAALLMPRRTALLLSRRTHDSCRHARRCFCPRVLRYSSCTSRRIRRCADGNA